MRRDRRWTKPTDRDILHFNKRLSGFRASELTDRAGGICFDQGASLVEVGANALVHLGRPAARTLR